MLLTKFLISNIKTKLSRRHSIQFRTDQIRPSRFHSGLRYPKTIFKFERLYLKSNYKSYPTINVDLCIFIQCSPPMTVTCGNESIIAKYLPRVSRIETSWLNIGCRSWASPIAVDTIHSIRVSTGRRNTGPEKILINWWKSNAIYRIKNNRIYFLFQTCKCDVDQTKIDQL